MLAPRIRGEMKILVYFTIMFDVNLACESKLSLWPRARRSGGLHSFPLQRFARRSSRRTLHALSRLAQTRIRIYRKDHSNLFVIGFHD